jgi:16S rRNA (uracil1498-N3)-methyltransferase
VPDRFHVVNIPASGTCLLEGPEAHHLMHVLRVQPGEVVELFDGMGHVAQAVVTTVRRRDVELTITTLQTVAAPKREVILATAVPKGDRFDWLIEKATELGVTRIIPLITARSSVDPRSGKLDKLRQTVIAACKQSGRNHLLELSPVCSLPALIQSEFPNRSVFVAHPTSVPNAPAKRTIEWNQLPSLLFLIGPEGGFTDDEVSLAINNGAQTLQLGLHILRIETAAITVAAIALSNQERPEE